jgi:hypothetical protein
LKGLETSKQDKCVLVLEAKEEAVLQGMIERQIEIGGCCGMQKNV